MRFREVVRHGDVDSYFTNRATSPTGLVAGWPGVPSGARGCSARAGGAPAKLEPTLVQFVCCLCVFLFTWCCAYANTNTTANAYTCASISANANVGIMSNTSTHTVVAVAVNVGRKCWMSMLLIFVFNMFQFFVFADRSHYFIRRIRNARAQWRG